MQHLASYVSRQYAMAYDTRFCAPVDQQLKGVDFFETYALVFQLTMICLMFVLDILLGLKSMQGDVLPPPLPLPMMSPLLTSLLMQGDVT